MARPNDVYTHTLDPRAGIMVASFIEYLLCVKQPVCIIQFDLHNNPISDCYSSTEQAKALRLTGAVWLDLRTSSFLSLSMCRAVLGYDGMSE